MNISTNINRCVYVLFLLLIISCTESKRYGSSGRRTTPRSRHQTTRRHETTRHTTENNIGFDRVTPSSNRDIGFENVQNRVPPQNNQPHVSDTFHQTNAHPVGNPPGPIGFENVQNRLPAQNNQHVNDPFRQTNVNPVGNAPGSNIGFENVQNRAPPQNNQPPHGYPQQHYPGVGAPPQYNQPQYHPGAGGNYQGSYPGYNYQNPPNIYQPTNSYYNPNFASPGLQSPPIYQPVQKSSGVGSVLGYAGTFAGGYLIGRLTSGGGSSGDREYTVHHYHHNANEVPKQLKVTDNALINCTKNGTEGLCVPNTFPICLANGTIMCVTHSPYTTPCGTNSSMACVVSILPCTSNDSTCNTTANFTTTAVYVPCISNVTVSKQKVENSTGETSNDNLSTSKVDLCVTAIAEPKKMESPAGAYLGFLGQFALIPLELNEIVKNSTNSTFNSSSTVSTDIVTTTPLPVTVLNQ